MQYPIPQFLEIEDKIVGPLTAKQTVYILAGGGILLIGWSFLPRIGTIIFTLVAIPTVIIVTALAFYRPQGRSLATLILASINYYTKPKMYVWQKVASPEPPRITSGGIKKEAPGQGFETKVVSKSRLQELAWILDTKQALNELTRE